MQRMRQCVNGAQGDEGCMGDQMENKACNTQQCPFFSSWSAWSQCSVTCGGGQQSHSRQCVNGQAGDIGCEGPVSEDRACNVQQCPAWGNWFDWQPCSASCGAGAQRRMRACNNGNAGDAGCLGDDSEIRICNTQLCPGFSMWSEWSACSVTCGEGEESRSRTCLNGNAGSFGCEGPLNEKRVCRNQNCVFWSQWTDFGPCSRSCGTGGVRQRTRTCNGGNPGDSGCQGSASEIVACENAPCPSCEPDHERLGMLYGIVQCTNFNNYQSSCVFQCNNGYFITGYSTLTCESNGDGTYSWNHEAPVCVEKCTSNKLDIALVIDSSSSVKANNFELVRGFLQVVVNKFEVGPDDVRFSAIRYNRDVEELWNFGSYNTIQEYEGAIMRIPYDGSGTRTGQALDYVNSKNFMDMMGNTRRDSVKLVMLLTDGNSQDNSVEAAERLKAKNIYLTVVGIGERLDRGILGEMASAPKEDFTLFIDNFALLNAKTDALVEILKQCNSVKCFPNQSVLDLVLMVDTSSSVGQANFVLIKDFLANIFGNFPIGSTETRVGMVTYNNDVNIKFYLNTYTEKQDVLRAITEFEYEGVGTQTGKALIQTTANMFRSETGHRDGVPSVTILITDGISQDPVNEAAKYLQAESRVIAVGIGATADVDELQLIASGEGMDNVFTVNGYETLTQIQDQLAVSIASSCNDKN